MLIPNALVYSGKTRLIAADDRVFLGEGLFETIRVDNHRPHYSQLHWQRLRDAAVMLHIPFELSFITWNEQLLQCIGSAQMKAGGIKVVLSGGPASRGLTAESENTCLLIKAFTYAGDNKPLNLVSASWRRDANNPVYQVKSINYLEAIIARRQALDRGADDALFFNSQDYATETTVANLFLIKKDQVYTPALTCGILAGIIRNRLLALCADASITCIESNLDHYAIRDADGVFVTNSLQGIRLVESLDGTAVPTRHNLLTFLRHRLNQDSQV